MVNESNKTLISEIIEKYPCPDIKEDGFYIDPNIWVNMVRNVIRKEPTLLIAPSGSGKPEAIELLSKRLQKICYTIDMGAKQDPISSLVGTHRIKNGQSKFDQASFVNYIQTDCIINLDEINRSAMQANNILLPLLDSRKSLSLDIATSEDARTIKSHDELVFFATANDGAEYVGTYPIDRAVKDRFRVLRFGYPPETAEINLLIKRTKCPKQKATPIVKMANDIRKLHNSGDLSTSVSVRHTLHAGNLITDGFDLRTSVETAFLNNFKEEEHSQVQDIFSKY